MLKTIEQAFEGMDRFSSMLASSQSELTQLDQSILAKAFRGELVAQDPNDEPASMLLKRIKQHREEESVNNLNAKKHRASRKAKS